MKITIDHLFKSFQKDTYVIQDLNLEIEDKSFTTLLGPSGCGKTTLLRMIAGLDTPDSGEIYFDDICMFSSEKKINIPPEKRKIGFVFQDFALWPHMTVFENVAFGLRAHRDTEHLKERVMEALEIVKLQELWNRYPDKLSGGQGILVAGVDYNAYSSIAKGEPLQIYYPKSGTVINPRPAMILKTSKNVDNAKAFMDYLLSDEAQKMVADAYLLPGRTDVPCTNRSNVSEIPQLKTDWTWMMKNSDDIASKLVNLCK